MFESFISKLKSDGGYYLVSSVFSQLFLFVSTILIMRTLSVGEFGLYSIFLEYATLIIILLESGTRTYYIKTIEDRYDGFNIFTIIFQLKVILILTPVLLIIGWFLFLDKNYQNIKFVYLGSLFCLLGCMFVPYQSYLIRAAKKKVVLFRELSISTLRLVFSIFVLYLIIEYDYLYLSFVFIPIVTLFLILRTKKIYKPSHNLKIRSVLPFIFTVSCSFLYNKVDIFMLAKLVDEKEVAVYAAGYKFIFPMMFISMVLNQVLLPVIIDNKTNFVNLAKCSKFYFLIGILVSIVSYLLFYLCNEFLFDGKYSDSYNVVTMLILYLPVVFAYGVFSNYLMTHGGEKIVLVISIILTLVNIFINILLIPKYGAVGAATATIMCEFIIFFLYYSIIRKRLTIVQFN